jgi:hypothetical protein
MVLAVRANRRGCANEIHQLLATRRGRVNHHALSDFRVDHDPLLDRLLTASVTALVAEGLTQMVRLAQDGVKVRTGAGVASFCRRKTFVRPRDEVAERIVQ